MQQLMNLAPHLLAVDDVLWLRAYFFMQLANSSSTHSFLAKPAYIEGLLIACLNQIDIVPAK